MNKKVKTALTCLSCLGVGGVALSAVHDTNKHSNEKLTIKEYTKKYWKDYILTASVGMATIGSIIANHTLTAKDIENLGALALSVTALLGDYKQKIKEVYGDKGLQKITSGVAEKRAAQMANAENYISIQSLVSTNNEIAGEPATLFYDEFSDTWFYSTLFNVKNAMYHFNRKFTLGGEISVDEFYTFLGITPTIQWPKDMYGFGLNLLEEGIFWIDFDLVECKDKDGVTFYSISFTFRPVEYNEEELTYAYDKN